MGNNLNIDKANKLKPNYEPKAASVTSNQTQSIVVVPVGKAAEEDNPITKLINSDAFKALPKDEQLAELKKMLPNLDESQINEILSTSKKEAPEVTDGGAVKPEVTDDETKPEVTVPKGEDKAVPKEQADMKAIAQVGAQIGIKNPTVDDLKVIYNALSKKAPDELSPAEKKVMEFIGALSSQENRPQQMMKLLAENAQAIDNIIPKEVLESKEWKSKTPEEKLYARIEIVLDKLDPNFAKIEDPAQKEAYMKGVLGSIAEAMNGGQKMSETEKDYHISVIAFLADAAEQKGVTMSKLVGMMQDKSGEGQKEFLELAINLVDDKGLLNGYFENEHMEEELGGIEYFKEIANIIMKNANHEKYDKLLQEDPEAINHIAAKAINIIGKQAYGGNWVTPKDITLENLQKANEHKITSFVERFKAAKYAGETKLAGIIGRPGDKDFQKKAVQQEIKYYTDHGMETNPILELERAIRMETGKTSIDVNDIYNNAIKKPENERTIEEKNIIAMYRIANTYNLDVIKLLKEMKDIGSLQAQLKNDCKGDILKLGIKVFGNNNAEEFREALNKDSKVIIKLAMIADVSTVDEMKDFLSKLDIDFEAYNYKDLLDQLLALKATACGSVQPTSARGMESQNTAIKLGEKLGLKALVDEVVNNYVSICGNDNHKKDCFNLVVSFGDEYDAVAGKFLNNKNNTQEFNNTLARETFLRTDLSDSRKESLTDNYLKYADNDAARINNVKNIQDIDNEGVKRGIIGGQNYLESDSARQEYSNIVNEVINSTSDPETRSRLNSYNQEVQANIGSSNSSSSSSSSGTGKSSGSQGTSGSHGTSSSHGTSGSNGTSGSSNTPKTGSSSNSSSAQSAAAQARAQAQQDYAQAVTQALQLRKEEALKRLAQITENYQKSVKEREERKAKEAQKTQKTEEQSTNKDYSKFDPEVRKVLEESDRVFESADKTLEIAKIDSALTDAEIAVPADKREELIQAYQSGGAASLYEKLGSVSTKYQEQYLYYFAEHASTSDLCSFAEKHVGNKNIILALYQRSNNPALLQYLGESNALDLLNKGKIKLEDFLKYASPDTVARYIQSMKEIGNTDAIKAVVSQLSLKQREETSESVIAEAQNNTPLPGSDEWIRAQQKQMENASNLGVEPKASAPKRETEKLNLDGSTPTIGAGMLSLNPEEDEFDGLSMGSNRVRMGIDIKKRDKRFFRIG